MNLKITSSHSLPNIEPTKSEPAASKAVTAPIRPNVEHAEVNSASTKKWELSSASNHIKAKAFSASNVNTAAAWPSKPGFNVHQRAVGRALFNKLPASDIRMLQDAVKEADNAEYQTKEMSHRHAMTQEGLTKPQARKMANDFVRSELETARRFQAAGNRPEALRHLGFAMHAMQDATSPAHQGFQVYHGDHGAIPLAKLGVHVVEELHDPGPKSNLDKATEKAYKYFTGELPMPKDFFAGLGSDK